METLTRLVTDSLARHGFDRPPDPRRLQWSRWSRCDSPHSLLVVPSKPGIFALAEEVMNLGASTHHVETAAAGCPERSSAPASSTSANRGISPVASVTILGGAALQRRDSPPPRDAASAAEAPSRRMLAVLQFAEDDDMAFVLDRMFMQANPLRTRLATGRCFLRFVVIEDQAQRRSICNALNQWMRSSAEKASGGVDFQSSLELMDWVGTARVGRTLLPDNADTTPTPAQAATLGRETDVALTAQHLESGANKNLHCPHPLPSGF